MHLVYYMADVFTERVFHGAQVVVFPDATALDTAQMALIARELNVPQTVFALPPEKPTGHWRVRIFSPVSELDFGGHSTIAAAHVLAATGKLALREHHTHIVLEQKLGPIDVFITEEGGRPVFTQFTLRVRAQIDRFVPPHEELADLLSLDSSEIEKLKFQPLAVSCGFAYLIVPLRSYATVRKARFDFSAWGRSSAPASLVREILLFSTQSKTGASDFHARLVGPPIGVNEDPPIGSAMPAFAHYLSAQPRVKPGTYTYTVDRGETTTRQSILRVEMDNKKTEALTVRVGGPAVLVSTGRIDLPDAGSAAS
ncbi:MAG: PhzF family phenazine biosynthesis protein [Gammaproteobacteria bacterium]